MNSQSTTEDTAVATPTYRELPGSAAQRYQEFFVPAIGLPVAAELMRAAALQHGDAVLDVACGTGVIARLAAAAVGDAGSVAGVDVAHEMLEVAESVEHAGSPIEWRQADAASLPYPDDSFDVVTCQMGLMFMEDRAAALSEMRRVTKYGGRVVVNTPGTIQPPFEKMARTLGAHIAPEAVGFVRAVFSLDDRAELAVMLESAGLDEVETSGYSARLDLPGPAELLWNYINLTPMAPIVAAAPAEAKDAMEHQFIDDTGGSLVDGRVAVDQPMNLAIGRHR